MGSRRNVLEVLRRMKYALVRRCLYAQSYASLEPAGYTRAEFQAEATRARMEYLALIASIGAEAIRDFDREYCHPYWAAQKARFGRTLIRDLPETFLDDPIIRPNMVRRGWAEAQCHEEAYLRSRPLELRRRIAQFRESRVGGPFLESKFLRCSATSLGHLYYIVRITEAFSQCLAKQHAVIEFGGGYGSFARAYSLLIAPAAYTIVDFPEFLVIQQLYLRMNGVACTIVRAPGVAAESPRTVTLLPVYFLEETEFIGELFVSHFALSETPAALQRLVARRRFFGCDTLYLTGQYSGLQPGHSWAPHRELHDAIEAQYTTMRVQDFLPAWGYELAAQRAAPE
jgi:hypothetical protein